MAKNPLDDLSELDKFYHVFGKALTAWAEIEYGLSLWFRQSTGLEYPIAQDLFFSGRSFQTRSDLLFTALGRTKLSAEWCEFVDCALKKAVGYNGVRNRLAHGLMHPCALDENGQPIDWKIKDPEKWRTNVGFDQATIQVISDNFEKLNTITRHSIHGYGASGPPTKYLLQLHELPNEAGSTELSQKQKVRLRQFQSSRA